MLLAACSEFRGPAVPVALEDQATVFDNPAIRTWDSALNQPFTEELFREGKREFELRQAAGETGPLPPAEYLAISGGGADGAYGAGILCGWTAAGTRPEFKVVTGISTGALTAPFAFLGPAYDERLRKVYTSVSTAEICTSRGLIGAIFSDAMMDTVPLRKLLKKLVDEQMMHDIARESERGRILLVATTNLDANRGVIWNIGAIAASGHPKSLDLIHEILIASAAIPGAFPPVMIDVKADGKPYQEMHVDGGAKAQVFLYPPSLELRDAVAAHGVERDRVAYVIRNARLAPTWSDVQRRTLSIAGKAISSLLASEGIGDLYRIYLITQRDGVDFNLAYIPAEFTLQPEQDFDPVYMTQLFDLGYKAANTPAGYPWHKLPPGFISGMPAPASAPAPAPQNP
jgi:hypothetical protein